MNKKDFQRIVAIVGVSIHRINPCHLMGDGFPDDEFDSEIISIAKQLDRCNSGRDVAHAIARTLNSSFNENHQPQEFTNEGDIIYKGLIESGLKQ